MGVGQFVTERREGGVRAGQTGKGQEERSHKNLRKQACLQSVPLGSCGRHVREDSREGRRDEERRDGIKEGREKQ